MPLDSSGVVALVVLDTTEAEMHGDCSPTEHRWTYTRCAGTQRALDNKTRTSDSQEKDRDPVVTPSATRMFSSSHRQRSEETSTNEKHKPSPLVFVPPSESEYRHANLFDHFIRRSTAHGTWMKPHMMTSCLTLKWKRKKTVKIRREAEEGGDLGVVRQPHHVTSHSAFPERAPGSGAAATSCDLALCLSWLSAFATGLRAHGVLLGKRSRCP